MCLPRNAAAAPLMDTGLFIPPRLSPPPLPSPPSAGGVPKAKAPASGYKEIRDADSAGKDRKVGDASSGVGGWGAGGGGGDDERRIYLVVVLKARQPSVRQQHFSRRDGEGVTLVKYLGAPPPPPTRPLACHGSVGFLPGDLSVTLSRCIAIQGLWRVPQPDHEIGQLSCLPHPSTSSRSGDGTV